MLSERDDIEPVLLFLRGRGYFKLDAIKAFMALTGCGLKKANRTVHFSRTWRDRREAGEEFENMFWDEVIRWAEESKSEHSEND
jgi:ribosomal protein L7/L12